MSAPTPAAGPTPAGPDVSSLSFEEALGELERIVAELESGQAPLEQSLTLYARGAALKAHCEARLSAARLKIEQIRVGPDGQAAGAAETSYG